MRNEHFLSTQILDSQSVFYLKACFLGLIPRSFLILKKLHQLLWPALNKKGSICDAVKTFVVRVHHAPPLRWLRE